MPLARSAYRPFTVQTPRGLSCPLGVFRFVPLSGLASNQWRFKITCVICLNPVDFWQLKLSSPDFTEIH